MLKLFAGIAEGLPIRIPLLRFFILSVIISLSLSALLKLEATSITDFALCFLGIGSGCYPGKWLLWCHLPLLEQVYRTCDPYCCFSPCSFISLFLRILLKILLFQLFITLTGFVLNALCGMNYLKCLLSIFPSSLSEI